MKRNNPYRPVEREAEKVIKDQGISKLPVNPIDLARSIGIEVKSRGYTHGVSGMLLRQGEQYGIFYSTHINNVGFHHFSVAHELGHYFLPGHIAAVLDGGNIHRSRAGFISDNRYEREADHFAANILMPALLFTSAMKKVGDGFIAVKALADLCQTSLTATAIRYAQCTGDSIAVVLSSGNQVDCCFMSDSLKEMEGIEWIRKGSFLPKDTATFTFNQDKDGADHAEHVEDTCNLQDWFGGSCSAEITEEIVGLGNYGKTLTVLTGFPDPEEIKEESSLMDSWQVKF
ncbi:MAG: ImmA/IrrE family metallo-endopeptidase [Gammaproteobacteria bacterium]|nr:ImmA/IrrE family metallo-endopeptidase [Gammaproteobacteria bacterium]